MRAAYVERLGPPDEIQVGALATPVPGPTDVLVAVELVAANPVDTFVRSGRYPTTVPFPFVMSRDLFWETSGHHDFDLARRVLAPGSRILLSAASEDPRPLPVRELYISNVSLRGFVISQATVPQLAHAARLVSDMLLAGELVGQISEILPLPATPAVHGRFEAGTVTGPLLLRP